jgi:thymidylate kinase
MKQAALIILEGADCCGKTTLGKFLSQEWGAFYFHATASPKLFDALEDYHHNIMDNIEDNIAHGPVVMDRFWPSEEVYGSMFRPNSQYNLRKVGMDIHQRIVALSGVYIHCESLRAPLVYSQNHKDPAHALSQEQFKTVQEKYQKFFRYLAYEHRYGGCLNYLLEKDGKNMATYAKMTIEYATRIIEERERRMEQAAATSDDARTNIQA